MYTHTHTHTHTHTQAEVAQEKVWRLQKKLMDVSNAKKHARTHLQYASSSDVQQSIQQVLS